MRIKTNKNIASNSKLTNIASNSKRPTPNSKRVASNSKRAAPNSKRRQNLSAKDASTFCSPEFGVTPKCPRVYIRTFGCQMNSRDSELVAGQFVNRGYQLVDTAKEADVILLNTCSVREHAEDKVWSELGRLRKLKSVPPSFAGAKLNRRDNHPKKIIIGVIGCMARNLGNKIIERMPHVDLVVGPNDLANIYDYVKEILKERRRFVEVSSATRDKSFYKHLYHQNKKHSYVNISEGCSNFCSYCVVPYVRGRHRSRAAEDILKEIKQLVKDGVNSITLLGQNVDDYSYRLKTKDQRPKTKKIDFVGLVEVISRIKGVKELSFVTSHPKDIDASTSLSIPSSLGMIRGMVSESNHDPEPLDFARDGSRDGEPVEPRSRRVDFLLFDLMEQRKNIKKYLHLPVQSGSNRILKLMNRKYTRAKYLKIIAQYRKKVPNGILATDVIVGFPSETEKDFRDTFDLIKKVEFNFAYIFKYSPRPHTKAKDLPDDVPKQEKERRHRILLDLQKGISRRKRKS